MRSLQEEIIIDRAAHPLFAAEPAIILTREMAEGFSENSSCGDEVKLVLTQKEGTIESLKHISRACSLCTASADLLCEELTGKPLSVLSTITTEDHLKTIGLELSPTRQRCAVLPLTALAILRKSIDNGDIHPN